MYVFDVIILVMLTLFIYRGVQKGMMNELIGLTGWVIALLIAIRGAGIACGFILARWTTLPEPVGMWIGFFAILIIIRVFFQLFLQLFERLFSEHVHGRLDRLFGAILGFIKGAFFVGVFTLVISLLPLNESIKNAEKQSLFFGHMSNFATTVTNGIFSFAPQIKTPVNKVIETIENQSSP